MQQVAYAHERVAELCKAVAEPTRVRVLAAVAGAGELCGCHVEAALDITQSRASRHLAALKRAGLLVDRRDGAWVHYRVPTRPDPAVRAVLRLVREACAEDPATAADVARAVAVRDGSGCGGGQG
jgi:ArsR family transcriptional regulator